MARTRTTRTPAATRVRPKAASRGAPPAAFRARVRMYRQGLGDCFLVTFPRRGQAPFHLLIDCGVLHGDADSMVRVVEHIRDSVRGDGDTKARLDVVVATHEHKDHLSGFNQARTVFNNDFDIGAVWLGWTENLTKAEIRRIKQAKKKAVASVRRALDSPLAAAAGTALDGVEALLAFSEDDDDTGTGRIADALEYLKRRGTDAGRLEYLEPGDGPLELDGVDGVRVYVLGPPRDPILLKGSEVTERLKREGVIYHLARTGEAGIDSLSAAVSGGIGDVEERCHPFAPEHRVPRRVPHPSKKGATVVNPALAGLREFLAATYDEPKQQWRQIDSDWLAAFRQLALDLDNDTNNTSLVLAFEFVKTREVLLFVGDAQVGNWQSWATLTFTVPGRDTPLAAHDLLGRTVFYKVGHHCSHNATLREGGLELMTREDLVAFVPLDRATARKQKWDMPAGPLFTRLQEKTGRRVVISDAAEPLTPEAAAPGVVATPTHVDYYLK